jgi:hypothetical protein
MKQMITLCCVFLSVGSFAQTWSDDVAAIVYNKCATCHHTGGIAPFSLMTYDEVSPMASAMHNAIINDEMPPWPPDNNYQQYSHARSLSPAEKTTMLDWLSNGFPEGNQANTPPPPVFNPGAILGTGDLTIQIPTYMSKAQGGQDDYVCFSIPVGLAQQRTVRAIEIVPGNRQIVHHALIYIDGNGAYQTDTTGGDCGGPQDATLIGGYTPGSSPLVFPSGPGFKLGMDIPVGSNIVLAMHYPEGSYGEYDSTKVIFHFYPPGETGIRTVYAAPVLQNWLLSLPPNQVTTANAHYPNTGGLPIDISVLSVFPHMHLLGETMKAYALTPLGDTVKYVDVPHWDFHWQDFYFFRHIQKTPAGSVVHGRAVYDNTVNNPHNPSNPPVHVFAGESTTDEMFLVYFHYMYYQAGDELYDLESLMNVGLTDLSNDNSPDWKVYPVPFTDQVTIDHLGLQAGDRVTVYIYDQQGRVIRQLAVNREIDGSFTGFTWDGTTDQGAAAGKGHYFVSMNRNGSFSSTTLLKQ